MALGPELMRSGLGGRKVFLGTFSPEYRSQIAVVLATVQCDGALHALHYSFLRNASEESH